MALMVGAMTIHGIVPGPQVMTKQPELFWGMIASMWIGNLMLIVINLPLVGIWVRLLRVPYRHLFPMIVIFCCIGVYSLNNAPFDVSMTAIFGVVGYWLVKHDFEPAPMILGFVLGPLMEENLRRAMLIARGDATVFLTRPISATLLGHRAVPAGARGAAVDPRQARRGVHRVAPPDQAKACAKRGGRLPPPFHFGAYISRWDRLRPRGCPALNCSALIAFESRSNSKVDRCGNTSN